MFNSIKRTLVLTTQYQSSKVIHKKLPCFPSCTCTLFFHTTPTTNSQKPQSKLKKLEKSQKNKFTPSGEKLGAKIAQEQQKTEPDAKIESKITIFEGQNDSNSEDEFKINLDGLPEEEDDDSGRKKLFDKKGELIIHTFANAQDKRKETFLECLRTYQNHVGRKRELTAFIPVALKYMEEFGVHKDLQVYKELFELFPKEKMIPSNQFQTMFMHYPREQYCAVTVLEVMECNQVIPDGETELILLSIFGRHGLPLQKFWNMMYWLPKFKHVNPWPVPRPIPDDVMILAQLAMEKIGSIDLLSKVVIYDTKKVKDAIDKTWVCSVQSPTQSELLQKHKKDEPLFVEGPFRIWVANKCVDYFTLRADSDKHRKFPDQYAGDDVSNLYNQYSEPERKDLITLPNVHEQEDGTYFACCATGTSTKDSLLSWIRCLQDTNPVLSQLAVIFTLRNYSKSDQKLLEEGTEVAKPVKHQSQGTN